MALLTLFQTISVKIARRNARSVCEISHSIPAVVMPSREVVTPLSSSPLTVSITFFLDHPTQRTRDCFCAELLAQHVARNLKECSR